MYVKFVFHLYKEDTVRCKKHQKVIGSKNFFLGVGFENIEISFSYCNRFLGFLYPQNIRFIFLLLCCHKNKKIVSPFFSIFLNSKFRQEARQWIKICTELQGLFQVLIPKMLLKLLSFPTLHIYSTKKWLRFFLKKSSQI